MASSKTFLLGLAFVVVILIFSEVSARELLETHPQTTHKALPGGKVYYGEAGRGGYNRGGVPPKGHVTECTKNPNVSCVPSHKPPTEHCNPYSRHCGPGTSGTEPKN